MDVLEGGEQGAGRGRAMLRGDGAHEHKQRVRGADGRAFGALDVLMVPGEELLERLRLGACTLQEEHEAAVGDIHFAGHGAPGGGVGARLGGLAKAGNRDIAVREHCHPGRFWI
jgi:hypothetical protein